MYFTFDSFHDYPLRHAMSMRNPSLPSEGDVAYAHGTITEHITSNRTRFLNDAAFNPDVLTLGRQVHGNTVVIADSADCGRGQPPDFDSIPDSDGLVTESTEIALGSIVADCAPILLYDPARHALGLLHAGWRGTVAGIAREGVERMGEAFGSRPQDIRAGIGPSIGPCCYEVGDDVTGAWIRAGLDRGNRAVVEKRPRPHFDLWMANRLMLESAGIDPVQIEVAQRCTRCAGEQFFSHRAAMAGDRPRGRMIMVAQLT